MFLLAKCDRGGFADIHPNMIARMTGMPDDAVRRGLAVLESPDLASRTPDLDGCRIERIDAHRDWGWRIVNHMQYRTKVDAEVVRAQTAARVRKSREVRNGVKRSVTVGNAPKRHAEAEAEAVEPKTLGHVAVTDAPIPPAADPDSLTLAEWFDVCFWPPYPLKVDKADAFKALRAAFKGLKGDAEDALADAILRGVRRYAVAAEGKDRQFIKHPGAWVRGRKWEDEDA